MENLIKSIVVLIMIKIIIEFFGLPIPKDIKTYYEAIWKVQKKIFAISNNSMIQSFLHQFGTVFYFITTLIGLLGLLYTPHKIFFMWIVIIPLLLFPIVEFIVNGYDIMTSTAYFFKRAIPLWFFLFLIAFAIATEYSNKSQTNGYLLYLVFTVLMCVLWFFLASLASLKVTEMVTKLLKSGVATLSAVWATIYAFLYIQTPSFIASVSVNEIIHELSKSTPYNSHYFFADINVLEVFKIFIPIIVLPFLLIMIIIEAVHYTKKYWMEKYNNNQDIDNLQGENNG